MRKAKGGGASGNTPMSDSDKSAQQLRALQMSEASNKTCLDCGQRGPTYVNMTIGSFVCTKCSGMLRGINPPHRIKSISMSSFSADEIDFLRSRGNLWCQLVWLGLYEGHKSPNGMDEERVKEFIIEKYEKKRYYVDPSTIATSLPQPNQSNLGGWTSNESSSGRSNLIGSTLTGRLGSGTGNAQTSRPNSNPSSTSSVVSRPTNSQPQPSENSLQSKPDSSFLADFSAFTSGPAPNPTPLVMTSNANPGVDPFGTLSKSQPNTGTPNNFNANAETNDFFADFDGAQFDPPVMATPIPKSQASTNNNTPGSLSASAFGGPPTWGATPPSKPLMQPKQQMVKQQATRPQSTPITSNQNAADKYAALKDLDEIFKSTVALTDSPSETTGVSIFGSSPIPASNLSKSFFEKESSAKGSIFDSTSKDSWATSFNKPENSTSPNAGTTWDWADRNGTKPRANSAAGTTGATSPPVNPFTGAGNMAQLNTSPWPTTGTSPVNNPPSSTTSNWPAESTSSNPGSSAVAGFDSDPFATFNLQSGTKGNTMDFFGTGSQPLDDPFATNKATSAQGNGNFDAFFQTITAPGNGAMGNGNPWTSPNAVQNDLFTVNNPGIPNSSKKSTNPFL